MYRIKLRKNITSGIVFFLTAFSVGAWGQEPSNEQIVHEVQVANSPIYNWESQLTKYLSRYLQRRGQIDGPTEDFDMQIDEKPVHMSPYKYEERLRDYKTQQLVEEYYAHQGINRYSGLFIESGAAWTGTYQWDTQHFAGLDQKVLRNRFLDLAVENKIQNIRYGINIHKVDLSNPRSLDDIVDFHTAAWSRGIAVTDSILFFSGLHQFETKKADGTVDPTQSYQNHPQFANQVEKITEYVLTALAAEKDRLNQINLELPAQKRKPVIRLAINPVNEPETFAGFNNFWNGAFAKWDDPNMMALYVPTIINIAKANVQIRQATEKVLKGERVLYFHNEAMTPNNYPSHQGDLRFAVSQLMLGDQQLLNADFKDLQLESIETLQKRYDQAKAKGQMPLIESCVLKYISVPANSSVEKKLAAKKYILNLLQSLQQDHLNYTKSSGGKTAKTDTILMLDYYQQSEFALPQSVPTLIQDLAAHQGEKLKKVMLVSEDYALFNLLQFYSRKAEAATGQKIWKDETRLQDVDIKNLLSVEDSIVLEKIIGLRNEWNILDEEIYKQRRARAHFDQGTLYNSDENRSDVFFNSLFEHENLLLKEALQISSDSDLRSFLIGTAGKISTPDQPIQISESDSVRDILNKSGRQIFYFVFGLKRNRLAGFLPIHYARQARAGLRQGFYQTYLDYVNHLGIRIGGIGESGSPYYPWAAVVQEQMMLEMARVAKTAQFYFVRHDIGPAIGTIGWMQGPMTGDLQSNGRRGEDGVFKLVQLSDQSFDYQLSAWGNTPPWYPSYRNSFEAGIKSATPNKGLTISGTLSLMELTPAY